MLMQPGVLVLAFVILSLTLGALVKSVSQKWHLPYSVLLLLAGLITGLGARGLENDQLYDSINWLAQVDPHLILLLFLPTLIFESAFSLETHLFKRMFSQIAILAVPGLLIATLLTAAYAWYFLPWQWSLLTCFLFGALISATDPVAVVALLKEVSSRKRLETLIEGESLLNDGTAIVLFTLFSSLLLYSGQQENVISVAGEFVTVVCIGAITGLITAGLLLLWISRLFNQPLIEITLTISAAYLCYFVAENILHVSGVVAVVCLGLVLAGKGRTIISPEVADFLHHFWQMMAFIANTLIFILVGLIVAVRIRLDVSEWWLALLLLYPAIMAIRALSVTMLMPILKRIGIGITREKAIVLIWGGLRGAVAMALALILSQHEVLPQQTRDQLLFLTAGIVVLTIVINSTSMGWLLHKLGLDSLPPAKQATVDKAKANVVKKLQSDLDELKQHEFLRGADWGLVQAQLNVKREGQDVSDIDADIAFRRLILETERKFYWSQFSQGALTGNATRYLVEAVEKALDGQPCITPRESLYKLWHTPGIIRQLNRFSWLNRLSVWLAFDRLSLSYEVARGFILAQQEIEKHVPALCPGDEERHAVLGDIASNRAQTRERVAQLQASFPHVSGQLETYNALRLVLNMQRAGIMQQVKDGVLDHSEADKQILALEKQLAGLKKQSATLSEAFIYRHLSQLEWGEKCKPATLKKLARLGRRQIYHQDEIIFRQGRKNASIAIVISGRVEVLSTREEYVASKGDILGAECFLTGRYMESARAIVPVDLLWFDIKRLQHCIARDSQFAGLFGGLVAVSAEGRSPPTANE